MELFLLYFWLKLNIFIEFFRGAAFLSATAGVLVLVGYGMVKEKLYPNWRRLLIIPCIAASLHTLLPTKTDVAVLVGGHYALKLSETPEAGKVMSLLRQKANEILDKELAK